MNKEEAYNAMLEGHKVAHEYYTDDEFIYMIGASIYDEEGYYMGHYCDEFWSIYQKWPTGWRIY